jgi:hypothetical protein
MNRLARVCPDAVSFGYRSIDRLILNAYIPTMQTPGAMACFLRQVRGKPILAGIVFKELTDDFVGRIKSFAGLQGLALESPARGVRPGEWGQQLLDKAARRGKFGVVGLVVHQEHVRGCFAARTAVSRSAENWFFRTFGETTGGPCVSRFPSSDVLPLARLKAMK